jgi:hypothetical protein
MQINVIAKTIKTSKGYDFTKIILVDGKGVERFDLTGLLNPKQKRLIKYLVSESVDSCTEYESK